MRVVVTSSITVGTALVGAFGQGGAVWRKGGVTVEASNSHGSYFASDITTLRAESRFALGLFRPSAFVAVTGLS
jgi:HK97 family phage major capsid protein